MNLLFNVLILLLPLGVVLRFKLFTNVFIYPIDIVVGVIFLYTLYRFFIKRDEVENSDLFKLVSIFLTVGFVSLLINFATLTTQQILISFVYSIRFAAYLSILFAAQILSNKQKNQIPNKLILSGAIFVILGFIQYFFYNDLRNLYYLGWDQHLYRLFSTFLDPNFAGAFLVLIFLLMIGKLIQVINTKNANLIILLFFSVFSIITLISIMLTYSRSAVIMLVTGISVFFVLKKMTKQLLIGVVIILGLVLMFANFRIEGLNPFRVVSSEARIRSMGEALNIASKNPLLGVGFNSYRYALVKEGARSNLGISQSNADAGTDNSLLFVAATTGLLGLFVYLKFIFEIGKKIYANRKNWIAAVTFSSLVAILIDSFFINTLFYIFILSWSAIMIGISLSNQSGKT